MKINRVLKNLLYDRLSDSHCKKSIQALQRAEYRLPDSRSRFAIPWMFEGYGHFKHLTAVQHPVEILKLYDRVLTLKPGAVLEVGTARGGTLYLWTQAAAADATIVSIDLPGGRFGGGYLDCRSKFYQSFARPDQVLRLLRADSHVAETLTEASTIFESRPIDFLFIDADHRLSGICGNLLHYAPMVSQGGLIALHDVLPNTRHDDIEIWKLWQKIEHLPGVTTLNDSR